MTTKNIYNIAHRGARSLAPENTMAAFIKAWQVGAHGVETDVSVTSDGELILFHDDTLNRTTNVGQMFPQRKKDQLHTFSLKEIESLDAGSWFLEKDPFGTIANGTISPTEQEEMKVLPVPSLEELLFFVKENNWFVNIEIKPLPKKQKDFPVVEKVVNLIDKAGLAPQHFSISSFHHDFLRQVMHLRSEIEVNALIGDEKILPQNWGNFEFPIYNANVDFTDRLQVEKALENGCRVNLYTINKEEEMRYFRKSGVDKIITDYPQILAHLEV